MNKICFRIFRWFHWRLTGTVRTGAAEPLAALSAMAVFHSTPISLIDTQLLLETDADGQANWQFNQTAGSRTGTSIRSAALRYLQVEQLAVTVRKAETGTPAAHYKLERLELTRSAAADSLAVELQGSLNGQPVALSGQTGPLRDLFAGVRFPLALSGDVAANGSLRGQRQTYRVGQGTGPQRGAGNDQPAEQQAFPDGRDC